MNGPVRATVLVLTRNAGADLPALIDAVRSQRVAGPVELLAIDSGSTDGTAEWLRRQGGIRLIEIAAGEFDHGLTRDLGIRSSRGEVVVLTVQDALPGDESWLASLLDSFGDPRVAGAWSRQVPRADANPFIRERLRRGAAASLERRVQEIADENVYGRLEPAAKLALIGFDNVSAAVRREVALRIPFRAGRFGEDLDWAQRVLLAGYRIIYEPRSVVVHSHDRSMWYEFKRVYADHQQLHARLGLHTVPRLSDVALRTAGGTLGLARAAASDPRLSGAARLLWLARALPFAFTQNLAQYLGALSARRLSHGSAMFRALDRKLGRGV